MGKKSKREEIDDTLPSKPPVILQNIKWVLTYGSKHKKIVAIGVLILILAWFARNYDVISLYTSSNTEDLIGVSVLIYHKEDQRKDSEDMKEKLNSVGAKGRTSQRSLPSDRTQGVVYYLRPTKEVAADALIDLFPKMELIGPELLEGHQSAYEGTDIFLYLP